MNRITIKNIGSIVDFLFEVGMLAKTPRSGFFFLGSGEQSVAEHVNRVTFIGYVLGSMNEKVDTGRIVEMCLFHDILETRTSDLNYVHQKYTSSDEVSALHDLTDTLPFGDNINKLISEYETRKSYEAKLAKDADNIELLLSLKEQIDIGNSRAKTWVEPSMKRLLTTEGKKLASEILDTDSDRWWFQDKSDKWWVSRNKD